MAASSIPGNENLRPETFGRKDLQLALETADRRPQTKIARAKRRKCRAIPHVRKLRQFRGDSKVDSNCEPLSDAFVNFSQSEGRGDAIGDGRERIARFPKRDLWPSASSVDCAHHSRTHRREVRSSNPDSASGRGFPPCKIRRRYKALARPRPVCGSHLAGFSASYRRMRLRVSMRQDSVSQIPVGLAMRTVDMPTAEPTADSDSDRRAADEVFTILFRSSLGRRLQPERRPLVRPRHRKVYQALSPKAEGQPSFDRPLCEGR